MFIFGNKTMIDVFESPPLANLNTMELKQIICFPDTSDLYFTLNIYLCSR